MIYNTCCAINITPKHKITCPTINRLLQTQHDFKRLCGLLELVGTIDGTHISIDRPKIGPKNCFCFKTHGCSSNYQVVVESRRGFPGLFLGMRESTNDARVLRQSSLHH